MKKYSKTLDKGPIATLYRLNKAVEELEYLKITVEDKGEIASIGKGLANTYGPEGKIYFHRILKSGNNYRYNVEVVDSLYSKYLKKKSRAGMGSVFHVLNNLLK